MSGPTRMQGIALGIGLSPPWFRDKRSLSQMGERVSHRLVYRQCQNERNADNGISQSQKRTQRRASLPARRIPTQVK